MLVHGWAGWRKLRAARVDWAKWRGFYAHLHHKVRPHFRISSRVAAVGFAWEREEVGQAGGERSYMALVLLLRSFSRMTAKAPRTRSRIKARSAFQRPRGNSSNRENLHRRARLSFASVAFVPTIRSRPCFHFLGLFLSRTEASGDVSLHPLEKSGFGPVLSPEQLAGTPPVSPVAGLAIGGGRGGGASCQRGRD